MDYKTAGFLRESGFLLGRRCKFMTRMNKGCVTRLIRNFGGEFEFI